MEVAGGAVSFRCAIEASSLIVVRQGSEFFEDLGKKKSSLASFRRRKDSEDVESLEGVVVVEDQYESESEDFFSKVELPASSWSHFDLRKAEKMVEDGLVFAQAPESLVVPVQKQADLGLYSPEEQKKRRKAAESPLFKSLVEDLWKILAEDNKITKDQYMELVFRFHYVCCPPPLDSTEVYESVEKDWDNDAKDAEAMDYPSFFRAIFQCVDTWTETSNTSEYVALLERLVRGAAIRQPDNSLVLKYKKDVTYDHFFDMDYDDNQKNEEKTKTTSPAATSKKTKKKKNCLLSVEEANAMIAKCYQAKMQADAAATRAQVARKKKKNSTSDDKSVRFDLFVLRFFKRSHDTAGVAKRHLRTFVRSVEAMLHADDDQKNDDDDTASWSSFDETRPATHARAALFADIVGVAAPAHNARLVSTYLLPVLRNLYPDMMSLARLMTSGPNASADPVTLNHMLDALQNALPPSLRRDSQVRRVLEHAIAPAAIVDAQGDTTCVDPDQALWLALHTFRRLDLLLAFRRRRCANVVTDYAHHFVMRWRAARQKNDDDDPHKKPEQQQQHIRSPNTSPLSKLQDARALDMHIQEQHQQLQEKAPPTAGVLATHAEAPLPASSTQSSPDSRRDEGLIKNSCQ